MTDSIPMPSMVKSKDTAVVIGRMSSKVHPRRWSTNKLRQYARRLTLAEMASVLGELLIMKKSMLGQRGPGCGADGGPWTGRPAGDVVLTTGRPHAGETEAGCVAVDERVRASLSVVSYDV